MTQHDRVWRDRAWRAMGALLCGGSCAAAIGLGEAPLAIPFFPIALLGLLLMTHGKRVATALRAERRGHGHTADVIHAERIRRHRRRLD
ncbi:hypothetical protein QE363_002567 [Sphingomonas sp. SORGH_AS870]|uniref:hypothetical protein n=1 Tax=Sphingomonas sp. SORGH_AS_0870 TaxID=3041801 RepID=UPI00285752DD|nr:hypothetical protein [Sphingomonas sp. SORGH_AS_0870]MDR6146774.1 hypothetical protein [Sphingomonas sp. SORGH_AS_0870]